MTILQKIVEYKKIEVLDQKKNCKYKNTDSSAKDNSEANDFIKALEEHKQKNQLAVIAEVKKASPSKGVICKEFNHLKIAKIYQKVGAAAISVLTDENFFMGKPEYLSDIKKISNLPILRKDFIIDEFQIYQTKQLGADIILLIASILDKKQLKDYMDLSQELNLDILLEVHDNKEFDLALESGAKIIGINNRCLKTFEVNINNTLELIKGRKLNDIYIISESGINNSTDISILKENGVSGILVGEALMNKESIEKAYYNLIR